MLKLPKANGSPAQFPGWCPHVERGEHARHASTRSRLALEEHKEHGKHRTEGAVYTVDEVCVAGMS